MTVYVHLKLQSGILKFLDVSNVKVKLLILMNSTLSVQNVQKKQYIILKQHNVSMKTVKLDKYLIIRQENAKKKDKHYQKMFLHQTVLQKNLSGIKVLSLVLNAQLSHHSSILPFKNVNLAQLTLNMTHPWINSLKNALQDRPWIEYLGNVNKLLWLQLNQLMGIMLGCVLLKDQFGILKANLVWNAIFQSHTGI